MVEVPVQQGSEKYNFILPRFRMWAAAQKKRAAYIPCRATGIISMEKEVKAMDVQVRKTDSIKAVIVAAALIAVAAFAYKIRDVFATVTISVFLYYVLDTIATRLAGRKIGKKMKISRLGAVIIALLVGLIAFALILLMLIPPIVNQVEKFSENMPAYTQQLDNTVAALQQKYRRMELPPGVQDSVKKGIDKLVADSSVIIRHAISGSVRFFSQIILLLMIPFITFYLLLEKESVRASIVRVFPRKYQGETSRIISESNGALRGYIVGQLILSFVMAVAMSVGLGLMGVKAPLLLGVISGITVMIPIIGVLLGCVPAAFVALSTSLTLALWVVAIFTVIQLLNNKVIIPLFFSRYVNLSPLTILVALMVGEQLGGVLGMFVATPVAAVVHVIYVHLREKYD
jgi:predicted PurR-regulated permease PerM